MPRMVRHMQISGPTTVGAGTIKTAVRPAPGSLRGPTAARGPRVAAWWRSWCLPTWEDEGRRGGGCRGSRASEEGRVKGVQQDSGALSLHVRATGSLGANALAGDEKWGIYEKPLIMRIWLGPWLNGHRSCWLPTSSSGREPRQLSAQPARPRRHRPRATVLFPRPAHTHASQRPF